jgi:tRNA threonylcarbamoyladenosine biosynthesis protein TsaE
MRPWRRYVLLLMTSLCTAVTRPAAAHPHVFIDNTVTFLFAGDAITALRLLWTFDEVFSQTMLEDFDADGDGSFSAAEVAEIKKTSLPSLKEFGYFTHLWVDGKPFTGFDATDLMVTREGDSVRYDMQITLTQPLDPRATKIEAAIYDDSYYVEVGLHAPGPVRFQGIPEGSCKYGIREDDSRAYYYETVYPEVITLSC